MELQVVVDLGDQEAKPGKMTRRIQRNISTPQRLNNKLVMDIDIQIVYDQLETKIIEIDLVVIKKIYQGVTEVSLGVACLYANQAKNHYLHFTLYLTLLLPQRIS